MHLNAAESTSRITESLFQTSKLLHYFWLITIKFGCYGYIEQQSLLDYIIFDMLHATGQRGTIDIYYTVAQHKKL